MERSVISDELYNLSFDTIEEDSDNEAWFTLIQNLSHNKLVDLSGIFRKHTHSGAEIGLDKQQFLDAICFLYGNSKYGLQSNMLFDDIAKEGKTKITWNDFLDFLIENLKSKTIPDVNFNMGKVEPIPHSKRETIVKITIIDPTKYFCYAVITKHGRVGLYDGHLNFLTSYHLIMSQEDITRTDNERRRRNRWVTDAIFCKDIQMFIIASSARSLTIYEASGLNHKAIWLLGLPNIAECLEYKFSCESTSKAVSQESVLYIGDCHGEIILLKFLQPYNGFLRKKHADKVSLFYWDELGNERNYLEIKSYGHIHKEEIKRIQYERESDAIVSCSTDSNQSLVIKYLSHNKKPYIYKIRRGCSCFVLSNHLKLLVTGSNDGVVRVWNPVIVSKPIAILTGHQAGIVDLNIMETQKVLITFSSDAVLKVWNLEEYKSYQTLNLKFPCFGIPGKLVEFGITSIHLGPKRNDELTALSQQYNKIKSCFCLDNTEERRDADPEKKRYQLSEWNRSNILVTCCNYMAIIHTTFKDINIEKSFEMQVLPPPPLQNSVLIPSSWRIQTKTDETSQHLEKIEESEIDMESQINELKFILDKDLLDIEGSRSDINYKIAILENKKLQMQSHVEKGAPYLALKLFDIEELRLSEDLPVPKKKSVKNQIDKIEKMLSEASMKDHIFSEPSSSRSRSSRSSIVDMLF